MLAKAKVIVPAGGAPDPDAPVDLTQGIPDRPENKGAIDFLKSAPTKGLWMPLGKEVKTMQCWRCKAFGHRTGDKECPLNTVGNFNLDAERLAREDPMASAGPTRVGQAEKLAELNELLMEVRAEIAAKDEARRARRAARREAHRARREARKLKHRAAAAAAAEGGGGTERSRRRHRSRSSSGSSSRSRSKGRRRR